MEQVVNPFQAKTIDVEAPSGRKFTVRELSAFEQMRADSWSTSPAQALYYRVVLAIETIDGAKVNARPTKTFADDLLKQISGQDSEALVQAYVKDFSPQLAGDDDAKNV